MQCDLHNEAVYGMQDRADEAEDEEDLGMAANSILRTIPRHVLKALEQQQAEANEVNADSRVWALIVGTRLLSMPKFLLSRHKAADQA